MCSPQMLGLVVVMLSCTAVEAMTVTGEAVCLSPSQCIFPFNYGGVSWDKCTEFGQVGKPWCATAVDDNANAVSGAFCAEDCPKNSQTTKEVCVAKSMAPDRCDSDDENTCLANECPASCSSDALIWEAYSAVTNLASINDAVLETQQLAWDTLEQFAPGMVPADESIYTHSTINYICCKDKDQVMEMLTTAVPSFEFSWRDVGEISWQDVGCSLNANFDPNVPGKDQIFLESFPKLDANQRLLDFAHNFSAFMSEAGFEDSNPRAMPFHFVISMANANQGGGKRFNTADALHALSQYNFGTQHLCSFFFWYTTEVEIIGKIPWFYELRAVDYDDCPSSTFADGTPAGLTTNSVEILLGKVVAFVKERYGMELSVGELKQLAATLPKGAGFPSFGTAPPACDNKCDLESTHCVGGRCVAGCQAPSACCGGNGVCDNDSYRACVAKFDPFCLTEWDNQCKEEATGSCGLACY